MLHAHSPTHPPTHPQPSREVNAVHLRTTLRLLRAQPSHGADCKTAADGVGGFAGVEAGRMRHAPCPGTVFAPAIAPAGRTVTGLPLVTGQRAACRGGGGGGRHKRAGANTSTHLHTCAHSHTRTNAHTQAHTSTHSHTHAHMHAQPPPAQRAATQHRRRGGGLGRGTHPRSAPAQRPPGPGTSSSPSARTKCGLPAAAQAGSAPCPTHAAQHTRSHTTVNCPQLGGGGGRHRHGTWRGIGWAGVRGEHMPATGPRRSSGAGGDCCVLGRHEDRQGRYQGSARGARTQVTHGKAGRGWAPLARGSAHLHNPELHGLETRGREQHVTELKEVQLGKCTHTCTHECTFHTGTHKHKPKIQTTHGFFSQRQARAREGDH
jgi:hypothetical protein